MVGPGSYESKTKIGEAPKYGMRIKSATFKGDKNPGPGQYNPLALKVRTRPPSAVIGKGLRDFTNSETHPGPGRYTLLRKSGDGPSFSFGSAKKLKQDSNVPGPGTYRLPCSFANVPTYLLQRNKFTFV